MNKNDLIDSISKKTGLTKVDSKNALEAFVDSIKGALKRDGDKVSLLGFGTFSISKRPERMGRNPKTGDTMKISAKNAVKFKAGKELSEGANK